MAHDDTHSTPEGAHNPVLMATSDLQNEGSSTVPAPGSAAVPVDEASSTSTIGLGNRPAGRREPAARVAPSQAPPSATPLPAAPSSEASPGAMRLLVPMGVGMVAGFVGAFLFWWLVATRIEPPKVKAPVPKEPVRIATNETESQNIKALKTQVERLAEQMDQFATRLEGKSNALTVEALQVRVDDLSRISNDVEAMPGKLNRMGEHVGTLDQMVGELRTELTAMRTKAENETTAEKPATASAPVAAAASASDEENPDLRRGINLFKKAKYKEAFGVFKALEPVRTDDARVWYFAALSLGFATNQWSGETIRLVEKGIECEMAGTPRTPLIDDAFRDLTPATGREWLAAYRRRVRAR